MQACRASWSSLDPPRRGGGPPDLFSNALSVSSPCPQFKLTVDNRRSDQPLSSSASLAACGQADLLAQRSCSSRRSGGAALGFGFCGATRHGTIPVLFMSGPRRPAPAALLLRI